MAVEIDELLVADAPEAWAAAGFAVDEDAVCRVGTVRIRLTGEGAVRGLTGWSLRGIRAGTTDLDGIATARSEAGMSAAGVHPNGVTHIDHVVQSAPDLSRAKAAWASVGLEPRRERDGELGGAPIRQVFYRLGEVILEVVGSPDSAGPGPSTLWGLTYAVADIDATAGFFGERTGRVKDAVQPGRSITTLRHRELGLSVRTALISQR